MLIVFAKSNKTFLTIIFNILLGRNFANLFVVIQAFALVFKAADLYLMLSKNVRSDFPASCNGLTSLIKKSLSFWICL